MFSLSPVVPMAHAAIGIIGIVPGAEAARRERYASIWLACSWRRIS